MGRYCIRKSPPFISIMSPTMPVHTLTSYSFKINFNIVHPYTPCLPSGLFPSDFRAEVHHLFSSFQSVLCCTNFSLLHTSILMLYVRMGFMRFTLLWTNCTSNTLQALPLPCRAIGDQSLLSCLAWLACGGARATSNVLCKQSKYSDSPAHLFPCCKTSLRIVRLFLKPRWRVSPLFNKQIQSDIHLCEGMEICWNYKLLDWTCILLK